MKTVRIIPKLEIKGPNLVKGIHLERLRVLGKPEDFAKYYAVEHADIKFGIGIGRTTYDASKEIRNRHLTRDEGRALVKKFDGEFPNKYFNDVMEFLDMEPKYFFELVDKFRSPHLWKKVSGEWKLRHTVNNDGTDD